MQKHQTGRRIQVVWHRTACLWADTPLYTEMQWYYRWGLLCFATPSTWRWHFRVTVAHRWSIAFWPFLTQSCSLAGKRWAGLVEWFQQTAR